MAVNRNLRLDQLLRRGIYIAGVSKCEIVANLLNYRNASRRVAQGTNEIGINFDRSCSEKTLHPIRYSGIERAAQQRIRSRIISGLLLLLRIRGLLILS